jgi:hypothetical protein
MAIPHNSNLSDGLAFDIATQTPGNLSQYRRYERLIEIHQHKGNSECYFDYAGGTGNPADPLCGFEQRQDVVPNYAASYVRDGVRIGLEIYEDAGIDPFEFGFEGATDDHNGVPGNVAEDTWPGHAGINDDQPGLRLTGASRWNNPGGITGVWAEQNTRADIYAALDRRETIGTSGPRIAVRLYQTWSTGNFCTSAFPGNIIADGGVPMGGRIGARPAAGAKPTFVVSALKDVDNLAEIDFVKVQVKNGVSTTVVTPFTVNAASACVSWTDTAYDPTAPAAVYARVLQVPTWRWSHYDCVALGAAAPAGCLTGGPLDVQIQERAWTSPIYRLP